MSSIDNVMQTLGNVEKRSDPDFESLSPEKRKDENQSITCLDELNRKEDEANGLPVFRPITARQFASKKEMEGWQIRNLIPSNFSGAQLGAIIAESNASKSNLMLRMAHHIATGTPMAGLETTKGKVAIVLGEGVAGFKKRLDALEKQMGAYSDDIVIVEQRAKFIDPIHAEQLGKVLIGFAAIFVDTLAANAGDYDENSARDTAIVIENLKVLSLISSATVVLIHHTGKIAHKGARGSSSLKAALDFELTIKRLNNGKRGRVTVTKARDFDPVQTLDFDVWSIEVGIDDSGMPITGPVLEFIGTENTPIPTQKHNFGQLQRSTLDALKRLQETAPAGVEIDTLISEVLAYFRKNLPNKTPPRKDAVKRTVMTLIDQCEIRYLPNETVLLIEPSNELSNPTNCGNVAFVGCGKSNRNSTFATLPFRGVANVESVAGVSSLDQTTPFTEIPEVDECF
jgi:hypothetical protein